MSRHQGKNVGDVNQFTALSKKKVFSAAFIMSILLSICLLGIFEISRLRQQRELVLASAMQLAKNSAFSFKVFDYVEIERVARESHLSVVSNSYQFITPGGEVVATFPKHLDTSIYSPCADRLFDVPLMYAGADVGLIRVCPLPENSVSGEGLAAAAASALVLFLTLAYVFWAMIRRNIRQASTVMDTIRSIDPKHLTLSDLSDISASDPVLSTIHNKLTTLLEQVRRSQDGLLKAQIDSATARTTQMLAHDVRKPFSSLEMGLKLIRQAKSVKQMREMADLTTTSVHKALITVNGLIDDVMEIGRTAEPRLKPMPIESLVEAAILELFQIYEKSQITLDLRLKHPSHLALSIEELKILRVFSNILGNGIQAIKKKGTLLIATTETTVDEQPFIEITLGNSGPPIPEEALAQLFEAFYTSGKEGGTGLGLAIAKKVVTAHGGQIWCESPGKTMPVEFHFTLPATRDAPSISNPTLPLPKTSDEAYARLMPNSSALTESEKSPDATLINDPREDDFERLIIAAHSMRNRPLRVFVIDDELIYRNAVTRLLGDNQALQRAIALTTLSSGSEALDERSLQTADVVISDIDLGPDSCNGYEVIKTLRSRNFHGNICVHSNRSLAEDFKRAMEAGADTVFPKPMSRAHILQILATAAKRSCTTTPKQRAPKDPIDFPYTFAVIEDERLVRSLWKDTFGERVQIFATAEDLLGDGTIMEQVRDALMPFDFLVTDFYLDEKDLIPTGGMVATIVRRFHPIPVFLCSSVEWDEAAFSKLFAGRLSKFDDLATRLPELIAEAGMVKPVTSEKEEKPAKIEAPDTERPKTADTALSDDLSLEALYALRHDIRNHLVNLQILARQLPQTSAAEWREMARQAERELVAVEPHCDREIIENLRKSFLQLADTAEDDLDLEGQIRGLAEELMLTHHTDPIWLNLETHPLRKKQNS